MLAAIKAGHNGLRNALTIDAASARIVDASAAVDMSPTAIAAWLADVRA